MPSFQLINAIDAMQRFKQENAQLVDIRDEISFTRDHVAGSFHLTDATVAEFMKKTDMQTPIFVICYHGNSSKGVAHYLCQQGYLEVYSVEGGMQSWRLVEPHDGYNEKV